MGSRFKTLVFFSLALLLQCGFSFGATAMNALFLASAGARSLGYVYIATPFFMAFNIALFTWILDRWGARGQLTASVGFSMLIAVLLFVLYRNGASALPLHVHVAGMLLINMWLFLLYTSFWNYADCFFDTREARTAYSPIGAGISGGYALGSLGASWLSGFLPVAQLFLVWAGVFILALPLLRWIQSAYPMQIQVADPGSEASFRVRIAHLWGAFRKSSYAMALAALFFLVIVMALLSEYLYLSDFEAFLQTTNPEHLEAGLAELLGRLSAVASLLNLMVNLLVLPYLINRVGVRNLVFVLPATYLVLFSLVSVEMNFPLAIGLFFTYQFLQVSVDQGNQNLLLRALPEPVGKELRTVVEGASEPLAVAVVGVLVLPEMSSIRTYLPVGPFLDTDIGVMGAGFAIAALVGAAVVRHRYRDALRRNLVSHGQWTQLQAVPVAATKDAVEHNPVLELEAGCSASSDCVREGLQRLRFEDLDPGELRRLLLLAPWFDTASLPLVEEGVRQIPLTAVPALVQVLQDPSAPHSARVLAAHGINRVSPSLSDDLLADLEGKLVQEMTELVAAGSLHPESGSSGLLSHWERQRVQDLLDLLFELVALAGRIPDFRAIRRMLHSPSPFDRAHALDVVEHGFSHAGFQRLLPILQWQGHAPLIDWERKASEQELLQRLHRTPLVSDPACVAAVVGDAMQAGNAAALSAADRFLRSSCPLPLRRLAHGVATGRDGDIVRRLRAVLQMPQFQNLGLRHAVLLCMPEGGSGSWKVVALRHSGVARALLEAGWKP